MPRLSLDHSDGRYYTRAITEEEAVICETHGVPVVNMEDHIYEAYARDCQRDAIWQMFFRSISNEQWMRRREKELLPLEQAEREISRLQEDLARAQRLEVFYEERYEGALAERHRDANLKYHCVFPQPGCRIEELPEEWRETAKEILDAELKWKRCCCHNLDGNRHLRLEPTTVESLRTAGFEVRLNVGPE